MTDTEHARIELRADTAANWTAANPTLAAGEPAFETDTGLLKIGDGVTDWASLDYFAGSGGGGGGGGAGTILALAEATASAAYSTTSAAQADVDATNLAVTFTVPASGVVLVEVNGLSESVSGAFHVLSVREGSTTLKTAMVGSGTFYGHTRVTFRITGLTPGDVHTYKLGHARLTGTGTATLYTGGNGGTSGNAMIRVLEGI